jgi:hypothetical protein
VCRSHLKNTLADKLRGLDSFMQDVKKGLGIHITEGPAGKAALMEVRLSSY